MRESASQHLQIQAPGDLYSIYCSVLMIGYLVGWTVGRSANWLDLDVLWVWFLFLGFVDFISFHHFMCMSVLPTFLSVCHGCAWCPQRPEESTGSPGTEVTDGCECPVGAGNKPGPLQKQPAL